MNVIQGKQWEVQQDMIFTILITPEGSFTWSSKNSSELRTLCVLNIGTCSSRIKELLTNHFGEVAYEEATSPTIAAVEKQQYGFIQWWMDFNQIEDTTSNSSEFKVFLSQVRAWVVAHATTLSDLSACPKFDHPAWWADVFGKCPWRKAEAW